MKSDVAADMPVTLNPVDLTPKIGTTAYPPDLRGICAGREKRALGDPFGLTHFGVNQTLLRPGAASALLHWHQEEDEFVFVLSGVLTLITEAGEVELSAGECVGFPAGRAEGHMIVNRTSQPAIYLEIGARSPSDTVTFPKDDLHGTKTDGIYRFTRKDGTPV